MSEVIILFGEMGSGKNYWGAKIAEDKGYLFVDGDDFILPEMLDIVTKFRPIPEELLNAFVIRLSKEVSDLAQKHQGIVLAQALYFNKDREFVANELRKQGHTVQFKWVKVPPLRNMKQLFNRPLGTAWILYWLLNKPWFETPTHEHELIS